MASRARPSARSARTCSRRSCASAWVRPRWASDLSSRTTVVGRLAVGLLRRAVGNALRGRCRDDARRLLKDIHDDPPDTVGRCAKMMEGAWRAAAPAPCDANVKREWLPRLPRVQGPLPIQSDIAACSCQRGPAWRNVVLFRRLQPSTAQTCCGRSVAAAAAAPLVSFPTRLSALVGCPCVSSRSGYPVAGDKLFRIVYQS